MLGPAQALILPSDESVVFGAWLNLLVMCSRAPETEQSFELCERNIASLLRKHPRGVALMLVVMHSDKPPDGYVARTLQLLKTFRPQILACVGVFEASGFSAAAHRAIGSSLITLSGMRSVISMFSDMQGASEYVAERMFTEAQRAEAEVAISSAASRMRDSVRAGAARPSLLEPGQ